MRSPHRLAGLRSFHLDTRARQADIGCMTANASRDVIIAGAGMAPAAPGATPAMAGEMQAANRNAINAKGFELEARRIARLMASNPHPIYTSLAEQLDRLRRQAMLRSDDSIEFLKQALEIARTAVIAERLDAEGRLDENAHLLDPHIGALTQIVEQYKPEDTPVIVTDVVRDIDAIARQVTYSGWNDSQPGDKAARREIRLVLQKYALPLTGPLFDNAYAYIRENY